MLGVGVVVAICFDALFTFLRRYLLLYATNRIDIRVATRTFGHLLKLPIAFFEQMPAGVLVKHMQQAGRIREFLTGRLFLTLLDGLSLFVFVPVLLFYSVKLTLIVLGFTALIGLVIGAARRAVPRRLQALYEAEGERQALLVETVHGMRTVKALAMEPLQRRTLGRTRPRSTVIDALPGREDLGGRAGADRPSRKADGHRDHRARRASTSSTAMTVGALVAFNMLAGRVSGPLVQIVTMVHEYQEVALSVRMLGEVMNRAPEETSAAAGPAPGSEGRHRVRRASPSATGRRARRPSTMSPSTSRPAASSASSAAAARARRR